METQKIYAAFAGLKRVVNGRTIITKMYDMASSAQLNNVEFTAPHTPEFHRDANGTPLFVIEKLSKNEIRNNSMQGAVVGTPGTLPTNWEESLRGLTREVVAIGTEKAGNKDVDYIDLRFHGTANITSAVTIRYEPQTQIVAAKDESWTNSVYVKKIAEVNAPNNYEIAIVGRAADGGHTESSTVAITPLSSLQRFPATRTLTSVNTERMEAYIHFEVTDLQAYDFTVRIGWPQTEKSAYPTLPIRTTGATVERTAPLVPYDAFLPPTGYVGFVAKLVRKDGEIQQVFHTGGADMTERSELALSADNAFYSSIFGDEWSTGQGVLSRTNPFLDWENNQKKNIAGIITWNSDNIMMWLCDEGGELYEYTRGGDFQINTDTIRDIYLGATSGGANHSSVGSYIIKGMNHYIDTEVKAKQAFEYITAGNLNIKAVNINTGVMGEDTEGHAGPTTLQAGNLDCGFFGEVTPEELFGTGNDSSWLITDLGITQGTTLNQTRNWLKLAWKGKVIFYPMTSIQHSISWDRLYIKGCMYGTGQTISNAEREMLDNAIVEDGTTIYKDWLLATEGVDRIPQTAQTTLNGKTYRVRLMKGVNDDPAPGSYGRPGVGMDNEWNRLILPLYFQTKDYNWQRVIDGTTDYSDYVNSKTPDWGVYYDDEDLLTHDSLSNGSYVWMQEFTKSHDPQRRVGRGRHGATYLIAHGSWFSGLLRGFRPVLESL